jgi:CDP-diacylglycerol--glycerol-3-phosphate 3-phosphatidyltransferase
MIARDILVDATRIVLGNKNIVVPANAWGKQKTIWQMIGIIVLFFIWPTGTLSIVGGGAQWWAVIPMYIATFFSILSGAIYLKQGWPYIMEKKVK